MTDLKSTPFNSIDNSVISTPNASFTGKKIVAMGAISKKKAIKEAQKEDDEGVILVKRKLFRAMVEKLKQLESIEDMTDIDDIRELVA